MSSGNRARWRTVVASALSFGLAACGSVDAGDSPDARPRAADASSSSDAPSSAAPDAALRGDGGAPRARLELRGTYPLSVAGDVAASPERNLVAISEWFNEAVSLLDVSDPSSPQLLARIEGIGYNADVQFKGDRLYINHEDAGQGIPEPVGIRVYDISDPTQPRQMGSIGEEAGHPGIRSCHNLWPQPDRALLYCASTFSGGLIVLSTGEDGIGTPDAPKFRSAIDSPTGCAGPHDMHARGNRLYAAFLCDGLAVYDIADPDQPVLLGRANYVDSFTHNIWPTEDGNYVLTTDEQIGGHVRVWDIRDLSAIHEVAEFAPNRNAAVHNVEIVGDTAYVAHYTAGVYAVDISQPTAPVELAGDDFFTGPDSVDGDLFSALKGAWGVEPVPPMVYVSSIETGLRIYELVESGDAAAGP